MEVELGLKEFDLLAKCVREEEKVNVRVAFRSERAYRCHRLFTTD